MEQGIVSDPMAPVMSAGGRRREALLRQAAEPATPASLPLTMADAHSLRHDRSPESRMAFAGRFGGQLDGLAGEGHHGLTEAILHLLLRDVEKKVRQTLAETVAASPHLPLSVALRLAHDDIAIAGPVIERSPVLTDDDLVAIVRTNAMQYALAVAGRENLSDVIAEALVDTGHQPVVMRLVGNATAKLSARTLQRVAQDWRDDSEVHDRLVKRPELPYEMVEHLVGVIGDRLEWELVRSRRIAPDEARRLMQATRERAAVGLVAREHGDRRLEKRLRERFLAGDLHHDDTLRFLRDGSVHPFEIALSLQAGMEAAKVRRLLYDPDRRRMAALCVAAGMSTPHYVMLRMALELAEESVANTPGGAGRAYSADAMRFLQAQYERLRLSHATLDTLLAD